MGLDMYLTAERYVSEYAEEDKALSSKITHIMPDAPGSICGVEARLGYWRKSNEIHNWFVQNVQDGVDECQKSYVSEEQLAELRRVCLAVLESPDKAAELLPTQGGFFFGSTEYDEWYFKSLQYTVQVLEKAIEVARSRDWGVYYRASW